jgi:hypothetical protein
MLKKIRLQEWKPTGPVFYFLIFFGCGFLLSAASPAGGLTWARSNGEASPKMTSVSSPGNSAKTEAPSKFVAIPKGTILPVLLETTISPKKIKPGEVIHGKIAQDVPLSNESKIRKGSKVEGHVVDVSSAGNTPGKKIAIRFDKLQFEGGTIAITTDLRAIAGFMEVLDAGTPNQAIGEGDVSEWMTTTQIGGDSVFGLGGPVTSAHNATEVVGKSPMSGGVLVEVRPDPAAKCRGPIDGNNSPQALWVFSSDACGTYGLPKVDIAHAGRTEPVGTVILEMQNSKAKIQSGAGLLLRVIA